MAANFELATFINEFMRLNSSGINAKLELQSYCGKVFVNINAELGFLSPPPSSVFSAHSANYYKPSRARRRRRRAGRERSHGQQFQEHSSSSDELTSDTAANDLIMDEKNAVANEVETGDVCIVQDVHGFLPDPLLLCPEPTTKTTPHCQVVNTQISDSIKKDEDALASTKLDMMMSNIMKDLNARR